jgi:tellurite resistance protein
VSKLTAEGIFKALVTVALTDGVLAAEELAVLEAVGARLRLAPEDTARWLAEVRADPAAQRNLKLPEDPDDAALLLEDMVRIAAADGVILASERKLIETVRARLGIDEKRLESLVAYHLSAAGSRLAASEPSVAPRAPARPLEAETTRRRFRILVAVAYADGVLAPEELASLDRIRARLGLDAAEMAGAIEAVKADRKAPGTVDLTREADGGAELLEDMVKIAAADGVIHPAERKLLERMRRELGIDEKRLESLLAYSLPSGRTEPPPAAAAERWPSRAVIVVGVVLLLLLLALAATQLFPWPTR